MGKLCAIGHERTSTYCDVQLQDRIHHTLAWTPKGSGTFGDSLNMRFEPKTKNMMKKPITLTQNRAPNPNRVLALGRCNDPDLYKIDQSYHLLL